MHDDVMGLQNETDQTMQDKLEWLEGLILSHQNGAKTEPKTGGLASARDSKTVMELKTLQTLILDKDEKMQSILETFHKQSNEQITAYSIPATDLP